MREKVIGVAVIAAGGAAFFQAGRISAPEKPPVIHVIEVPAHVNPGALACAKDARCLKEKK